MTQPMKFEVRNEAAEKLLKEIGGIIRSQCPPGYGFTFLLYSFGEGGDLFYISNAQREDMIRCMQEFIEKFREN